MENRPASITPPANVNRVVNQRPPRPRDQAFPVDQMPPPLVADVDPVVEEVPTPLEMFNQLRLLQN